MSSFQFSDEEKPQPPAPVTPQPAPPPDAKTPAPAEDEDDFSFLSQTPAQPSASAQPKQSPPPANNAARAKPVANRVNADGPNAARPQNVASTATPQNQRATAPVKPAPTAQNRPLQPKTPARNAATSGAAPAPTVATFDPNAPAPNALRVPAPAKAPNSAAAAALTPTPATPPAEEVTGMETGEAIVEGFFGLNAGIRRALDLLEGPAAWALRVFGVVGILALAFLLAALFFGGVGTLGAANLKSADTVRNLGFAAKGFGVCLVVAAISALILAYEDNKMGAIFAFVGAVLMFGAPLLVKLAAGETPAGALVGAAVIPPLLLAGRVLFYVGAFKATIDLFDFLWKLPDRVRAKVANVGQGRPTEAKQRAIASQANMMSPCWKLPFCREAIRVLCPAFIAKKTCWKFGRGCYCDEEMIARIVRGEPMETIKAPTRVSQSKPPCGRCYIYLEHQTYKFRMLSPLALPATIAIGFFGYPLYEAAFKVFDKGLQSVWGMFSFTPPIPDAIKTSPENIKAVSETAMSAAQMSGIAQIILGVILGFFLLIYLSKGIEWAIFKAKL